MSEKRKGEAVGGARVGSAGDPQHGQTAPDRRCGKKGKQLSKSPRSKIASQEVRGIWPMRHRTFLRRKVRKGGTKAVIVGQKEPGVAMISYGVAQEGMR